MHWIDYTILIVFLLLIVGVGISFQKKAGKNLTSFFLGGRNLPWYVAGISMVATTFAADTPLAVTELVGDKGIAGNWLWWNFLLGGMLTTFFFARLWRKANVLTEVELIELRYSGKAAVFLRGFKSVYLGLFMNVLIIGWVNVAMITILEVFFPINSTEALLITGGLMVLVVIYSAASGLLGIAITDMIQFFVAMAGCIILAVIVVGSEEIGGLSGLKNSLMEHSPGALEFLPSIESGTHSPKALISTYTLGIGAFLAYVSIQWWASWYPGAEPGGGGYVAQRMMSAKNEKHAVYATLFFQIAHYCIRPWPWIIVGLCALSLYGNYMQKTGDTELVSRMQEINDGYDEGEDLFLMTDNTLEKKATEDTYVLEHLTEVLIIKSQLKILSETDPALKRSLDYKNDRRKGYVFIMMDYLPRGLLGLLLAAFIAAYMSTISTQLNWGASYLVNDLYLRFLFKEKIPGQGTIDNETNREDLKNRHLIRVSRLVTVILMIFGLSVTLLIDSISGVWSFIIECGAGLGLVLILRWYWWRINAWSELAATITPFIIYALTRFVFHIGFPDSFFYTVGGTTVIWLLVTFITKPVEKQHLEKFYNRVQPGGWWKPYKTGMEKAQSSRQLFYLAICWISAVLMTYSVLFLTGKFLLLEFWEGAIYTAVAIINLFILIIFVKKTNILI